MSVPRVRRIGIFAAMRRELASLEAHTEISRIRQTPSFRAVEGRLEGRDVILASTGEGAENARKGAESLFAEYAFDGVVIMGLAGALSPALAPGSVLAITEILDRGAQVPAPDPGLLRRLLGVKGAIPATLYTTSKILCTAREKAEATARIPGNVMAAVDLETATFARLSGSRGIPFVAIRAVSDTATESLPVDFNELRDATGALDMRRIVLSALLRPRLLAPLWRLRSRSRLCSRQLASAVRAALAAGDSASASNLAQGGRVTERSHPSPPRVQGLG
jgi:adenosylhomocysteine nucleosidase